MSFNRGQGFARQDGKGMAQMPGFLSPTFPPGGIPQRPYMVGNMMLPGQSPGLNPLLGHSQNPGLGHSSNPGSMGNMRMGLIGPPPQVQLYRPTMEMPQQQTGGIVQPPPSTLIPWGSGAISTEGLRQTLPGPGLMSTQPPVWVSTTSCQSLVHQSLGTMSSLLGSPPVPIQTMPINIKPNQQSLSFMTSKNQPMGDCGPHPQSHPQQSGARRNQSDYRRDDDRRRDQTNDRQDYRHPNRDRDRDSDRGNRRGRDERHGDKARSWDRDQSRSSSRNRSESRDRPTRQDSASGYSKDDSRNLYQRSKPWDDRYRRGRSGSRQSGSDSDNYRRDRSYGDRNQGRDSMQDSKRRWADDRDTDQRSKKSKSDRYDSKSHQPLEGQVSKDNQSELGDKTDGGSTSGRSESRDRQSVNSPDCGDSEQESSGDEDESFLVSQDEAPSKLIKVKEELSEEEDIPAWTRCSPADLFFTRDNQNGWMVGTKRMQELEDRFDHELCKRAEKAKAALPKYDPPSRPQPNPLHAHKHCSHSESNSSSSSSSSSSDSEDDLEDTWIEELERKRKHPQRLHPDLWYNDAGEMNDGPLCRCSLKSKKTGIRHNKFPGELPLTCDKESNNLGKLYHYRVTMSPHTNFLTKTPTVIEYDSHEYIFEGFSLFSHYKLENIPQCRVIRFNIEYTLHLIEETFPENFSVRSLDLFTDFLFTELLEFVDIDWKGPGGEENCPRYHLMPRFARALPDNGKEILSMNEVLSYMLRSSLPLLEESQLTKTKKMDQREWQNLVDEVQGMIVTYPGKKPCSLRIDQLDRNEVEGDNKYPLIIHHGLKPAQLSYAGDQEYKKKWREYNKFRHLLNSRPRINMQDKQKLKEKGDECARLRMKGNMKREVTVEISSENFLRTGIRSDICQHAMLLPVLLVHLRFHGSLDYLESILKYRFKDRGLLQLALTHSSNKVNFGTNPDHARNSLSNCGSRQPLYGDKRIHYSHTRKKGINILMYIMAKMGQKEDTPSEVPHNERLEFLGDAVVEFITSIHLFFMFPWLEEGGLTTYRGAIVQNQQLAVLARNLHLEDYMLYAHGPDLCHESDLKHAMANCFEALMGALFIDGGIELADRVFSSTLFPESDLLQTWTNLPQHPLQEDEPNGDRHWIESSPTLQKMTKFEESIGVRFDHIRLLARSFSLRNVGYNNLTMGHNQRLEFLGDTIMQLVSSEFLFKHFPDHHEGHLSLLRSSLVNNRTQASVADDLGMSEYVISGDQSFDPNISLKTKDRADLLEALLGALYVDKGLDFCKVLCQVCFFPRLKEFILNQDWNDPKSQLQQCCLSLREMNEEDPDIPVYKVIECTGPTNTRKYKVAVYFRGERLASGIGHSIQEAEMEAATQALFDRSELFPILEHHRRFLWKYNRQRLMKVREESIQMDVPKSYAIDKPPRKSLHQRQERRDYRQRKT
ncbi:hypothetical protein ACJMK2_040272 [Sinanodonta woodiana]|uniref:Ribonuclease 3 n=1 Tax=Sinanodonta woodiana TaxID=1069815 RepID=A0ABD3WEJ1_SINWO